jgi:ribosomal protein S18 acetylase RimI-like enzyme
MADRMRRAEVVVLAKEDGKVVGCMALRYNKDGYMRRIISRARVSMPHKSLELCWIRVLPSRRDRGVEQEMFARIAMAVKDEKFKRHDLFGRKVFSIWPVEDAYSMALVESFGFTKTASDQVSDLDRNKRVQMFTWGDQPLVIEDRSSTPAIAN